MARRYYRRRRGGSSSGFIAGTIVLFIIMYPISIPLIIFIGLPVLIGAYLISRIFKPKKLGTNTMSQTDDNHPDGITTYEFFKAYRRSEDFTGIYILHNQANGWYYVGQSKNVLRRVKNHFTGNGNKDVYADYRRGHPFTIQYISLLESGYMSLDKLEKDYIRKYDAKRRGYNKTQGNG